MHLVTPALRVEISGALRGSSGIPLTVRNISGLDGVVSYLFDSLSSQIMQNRGMP